MKQNKFDMSNYNKKEYLANSFKEIRTSVAELPDDYKQLKLYQIVALKKAVSTVNNIIIQFCIKAYYRLNSKPI